MVVAMDRLRRCHADVFAQHSRTGVFERESNVWLGACDVEII